MTIKLPNSFTGTFTYVDCGAAGDSTNPLLGNFKDTRYIGFDPSLQETQFNGEDSINFPVAVSKGSGLVEFHRTRNPNCSSIYLPNHGFLNSFKEVGSFFEVMETLSLKTVALGEYLPLQGITEVDFMELDTQGAELGILEGAQEFLHSSVLGVRVEVEFSEMYRDQPMFGDVDSYLRKFGFRLFDLERYHLKLNSNQADIDSREQIVWGQALYLRDYLLFPDDPSNLKQKLSKLAVTASHYGFHSYTIEIVNYLEKQEMLLTPIEKKELTDAFSLYILELRSDPFLGWARFLNKPPLQKLIQKWWGRIKKIYEACQYVIERQNYFWKD